MVNFDSIARRLAGSDKGVGSFASLVRWSGEVGKIVKNSKALPQDEVGLRYRARLKGPDLRISSGRKTLRDNFPIQGSLYEVGQLK